MEFFYTVVLKVPTHSGFNIIYPVHYYPHSYLKFQVLGKATEMRMPSDRSWGVTLPLLNLGLQYLLLHVNTDCYRLYTPCCYKHGNRLGFSTLLRTHLSGVTPKPVVRRASWSPLPSFTRVSHAEIVAFVKRDRGKTNSLDRETKIRFFFVCTTM